MLGLSSTDYTLVQLIRAGFPFNGSDGSLRDVSVQDWKTVAARAQHHRLAPLLYAALKTRGLQDQVPAEVFEDLRMSYVRTDVANWQAFQELTRLLSCFERERIPVILLKGCALAASLYPNIALRPMSDLDLLVPQSLVSAVRTLLTQQGYSLPVELADGFQEDFSDVQVYLRRGAASLIEVHWNLFHSSYYHKRVPIQWFWQQTTEFRMNDRVAQTFSPEAQLLYLAGHMLLQGHGESLLWLYDVALLLARYREQMAWSAVIETVRLFELGQVLRTVLAHVSEIWGVAAPIDVQGRLNELPLGVNERTAFAIATARHLDAKVVWNGLNMPDLRSRCVYLARVIFPSFAYMQTRYRIRNPHLLPLYYLGRVGKGLSKFTRSAFSIAANTIRVFRFPQNG